MRAFAKDSFDFGFLAAGQAPGPLVLRMMEVHASDPEVLAAALGAFASLGIATESATDAQTAIATQGGLDLVFQAMRRFPSHCALLAGALRTTEQSYQTHPRARSNDQKHQNNSNDNQFYTYIYTCITQ